MRAASFGQDTRKSEVVVGTFEQVGWEPVSVHQQRPVYFGLARRARVNQPFINPSTIERLFRIYSTHLHIDREVGMSSLYSHGLYKTTRVDLEQLG